MRPNEDRAPSASIEDGIFNVSCNHWSLIPDDASQMLRSIKPAFNWMVLSASKNFCFSFDSDKLKVVRAVEAWRELLPSVLMPNNFYGQQTKFSSTAGWVLTFFRRRENLQLAKFFISHVDFRATRSPSTSHEHSIWLFFPRHSQFGCFWLVTVRRVLRVSLPSCRFC